MSLNALLDVAVVHLGGINPYRITTLESSILPATLFHAEQTVQPFNLGIKRDYPLLRPRYLIRSRAEICEQLLFEASSWSENLIKQGLCMSIAGESGVDVGGISTDVLSTFWANIRTHVPELFMEAGHNTYMLTNTVRYIADIRVFALGRMLIYTLLHDGASFVWPTWWDITDIKLLLDEPLNEEDLQRVYPSLMTDTDLQTLWCEKHDLIRLSDCQLPGKSLKESVCETTFRHHRMAILHQLYVGFTLKSLDVVEVLQQKGGWAVFMEKFMYTLSSLAEFKAQLEYDTDDDPLLVQCVDKFLQAIAGWSVQRLCSLLYFVTSSNTIPLKNKITFEVDTSNFSDGAARLPRASVCTHQLFLPKHFATSPISVVEGLISQAIDNGFEFHAEQ